MLPRIFVAYRNIKKVIKFLPKIINKQDVMTFSIFVVVSTVFWVAQSAYEQSDSTYEVTFKIENVPAGAVFTTHIPSTLKVTLYDNNMHLSNYGKNSSFRSLTVDFERYADAAGNFRISGAELQSLLKNDLNSTTQITGISPGLIDARFALTEGKKVPVHVSTRLTTKENYKDYPAEITPDSVIVHAPSYILDTLRSVRTERIEASELSDTLHCYVKMDLGVGVKATPDSVEVLVPVIQYVSKTFPNINIQVKDLPAGKHLILFPRQVQLRCLANFDHYNRFSDDDFVLSVSYDSLKANPNRQFLPIDIYTPLSSYEVYNIQLSHFQVEYTLEE